MIQLILTEWKHWTCVQIHLRTSHHHTTAQLLKQPEGQDEGGMVNKHPYDWEKRRERLVDWKGDLCKWGERSYYIKYRSVCKARVDSDLCWLISPRTAWRTALSWPWRYSAGHRRRRRPACWSPSPPDAPVCGWSPPRHWPTWDNREMVKKMLKLCYLILVQENLQHSTF